MTDKNNFRIRIIIATVTFFVLFGTIVPLFKNWSPSPNTIFSFLLLLFSFAMLANGVSFLSEIFKKDRKYLKILTGILSLVIFVFILFPQDQDTSPILGWIILIGLSFNSILISIFSLFEFIHVIAIMKVYSFVFALFVGVYSFFILSFISRSYNHSEAAIAYIIYGLIMFLISIVVNLITVSSLKKGIRGNS